MTHKKFFIISLLLVLTATVIITMSDYWSSINTTLLQAETYAERTALHISHHFFLDEDPGRLNDPGWFDDHDVSIRNLAESFGLLNIKIFNLNRVVVYSLDEDVIGQVIKKNEQLDSAFEGMSRSHVATSDYHEQTYGEKSVIPMLETYVPIYHPGTGEILGAFEIYQDYRPMKGRLLSETLRSGATHLIMLLVFAVLFYRYGMLSSRLLDSSQRSLIQELEDRVEERTVELKRSRDRVSELLKRKDEMFRNLMVADEYKKNFMGLVSHELRTPLTVIKGYLTMMNDGELGPVYSGLQDAVSTCLDESTKLEELINNILELSQLERGLFDLSGETFNVRELLTEAADTLPVDVSGREEDIKIEVSDEVAVFSSDRIKILQVIQQFLSNALKFSVSGQQIIIKASPSHRGMVLSVSDEGVGIPDGQTGEIFNLFHQADISTTRSYEGSGLGLAIVHKIGQILGGRAWVESEEGVGSTFYFEVEPLNTSRTYPGRSGEYEVPALVERPRPGESSSRSVLIVDDDEDYLFLLRRILIDDGYLVEMCKDGLEALNRIYGSGHAPLPSLIVLEIRMPSIHGLDLIKILRRNMITREIPLIVVSALGQETQVQEGMSAGANAYFVKPFDPDTLLDRIGFLLGKEADDKG